MKKRIFLRFFLVIIFLTSIFTVVLYTYHKNDVIYWKDFYSSEIKRCSDIYDFSDESCKNINQYKESLADINNFSHSVPVMFDYLFSTKEVLQIVPLLIAILIGGISVIDFSSKIKSKSFKQDIDRECYKKFMISNILGSYIYSLIIPLFIIIVIGILSIYCNGNFSNPDAFWTEYVVIKEKYVYYFFIMIVSSLFIGLYYINLAFISFYKYKKFLLNLLLFFILFISLETILPVIIELLDFYTINTIFPSYSLSTSTLFNYSTYEYDILFFLMSSVMHFLVSFIILVFIYKSKERFFITNS